MFQGYGASAATLAVSACTVIRSEPGALLCYHNPSGGAEGDYQELERSAQALRNARDCILEMYTARRGAAGREALAALMDQNIWITPAQALEYGLLDGIAALEDGGEAGDPAAFTAAAPGGRIRLTAAMRARYRAHRADRREAQAKRILTRLRVLANQ